nr:helix-turn-helix domain-containing protein [Pseudomonadota bacterium]
MSGGAPARDQRFSTTLDNGLKVLGAFRVGEPALSNRQFAERTGLSKPTVSRLTYTLAEIGFLKYDLELRKYRLGAASLSVSYPLLASLRIRQIARPLMRELADEAHGSVSLGMRDRTHMVYIETSRGHDARTFRPDIGASLPILRSAMGRAWAAQVGTQELAHLRAQIRSTDPAAWGEYG